MIDNTLAEDNIFKRSFIIAKFLRDYKDKHKINPVFVCLDDREYLYHDEYRKHLIWCNPDFGLTTQVADVAIEKLIRGHDYELS